MCGLGASKPKAPPMPVAPAPPPEAPKPVDQQIVDSYSNEKKAARAASGRDGTIKTGSDLTQTEPNKANKSLLG